MLRAYAGADVINRLYSPQAFASLLPEFFPIRLDVSFLDMWGRRPLISPTIPVLAMHILSRYMEEIK